MRVCIPLPGLKVRSVSHSIISAHISITIQLHHVWGLQVTCNHTVGTATMEVQSMSRLGRYDLGVNVQRTMAFIHTMHSKVRKGIFPDKPCYSEN